MYHSRRGDLDAPPELIPGSRPRTPSESWPSDIMTVSYGIGDGQYVASLCANAAIPQLPPPEFPRARIDYRLGPHEPMLYPQMWVSTAPHMAWVEKHELHRELHQKNIVGYVFQLWDWKPLSEGATYGRISRELHSRLSEAFYDAHLRVLPLLSAARTRHLLPTATITECIQLLSDLHTLAATFKESALLVTRVQRGIAELRAFRLFRLDVQHHVHDPLFVSDRMFNFVGVFTSDATMADMLHRLGIPAYRVLRGLPRNISRSNVKQPTLWRTAVETQPLDSLEHYHWDAYGRRHRDRREVSPPMTGMRETEERDERAAPEARSGHSRAHSLARGRQPRYSAHVQEDPTPRPSRRSRSPPPSSSSSRRSQSPRSARGSSRGDGALNNVPPRYILHEQARISDHEPRRHPDAPKQWRPRTWTTDPGHQAMEHFALPEWVPPLPRWMTDVANSVDRSVTREWRLCADDTPHAVPQDVFTRPLEFALPPLHLILKHEKRFMFVMKAWVALRDFWLRKIMADYSCGLTASVWRKILDDKYHIDRELANWIEEHGPEDDGDTAAGGEGSHTPAPLTRGERETLEKRVTSLSEQLHVALAQQDPHAGESRVDEYTRVPYPGDDLPATSSRAEVEPEGWLNMVPNLDIFFEVAARRMVLMDAVDFPTVSSSSTLWDEYWDYDKKRVLLFNRFSRVPDGIQDQRDKEILLTDVITWHQSRDDECGLSPASRAMWKALTPLVTNSEGRLVLYSRAKIALTVSESDRGGSGLHSMPSASDLEAETGQGVRPSMKSHPRTPPPDPVYGYNRELPNGHSLKEFVIRQHLLKASDLNRREVRAFLIWELEEAGFRFQLRRTDTTVLKSMKIWTPEIQAERDSILQKCWGGDDGFVPSGMSTPAQTDPDPAKRLSSIYHFWKLVRAWPRCREVANFRRFTTHEGLTMDQLVQVERDVWKFYAQTFYDYFGILPTLPRSMPNHPFSNTVST